MADQDPIGPGHTVNKPVEVTDKVLDALLSTGLVAAENALHAWQPWTAAPVLKQLIDFGLGWVKDQMYLELARDGTLLILTFQTHLEKSNFQNAIADLLAARAKGDPLQLDAANKAFNLAADALIQSDGSWRP